MRGVLLYFLLSVGGAAAQPARLWLEGVPAEVALGDTLAMAVWVDAGGQALTSVSAHVRFEGALGDRIREVIFTGDFFVTPPRLVFDLEAELRGEFMRDVERKLWAFFDKAQVEILTASPEEFLSALEAAYDNKETS